MKALLDAVHPAHVHFFGAIGEELLLRGHAAVLALRDRDVSYELAAASPVPKIHPPATHPGRGLFAGHAVSQGQELASRVRWLRTEIRREAFDIVLTRNPSGAIAARLAKVPSIFDTDDGRDARLHFRLADAFATFTTTPDFLVDDLGAGHRAYRGLKSTVFLHPSRFVARVAVLKKYGISRHQPLIVTRFSANKASHDRGVRSVPLALRDAIHARGLRAANIVTSVEGEATMLQTISGRAVRVEPIDFLHLLAFADLHVGDSGSVTMEAAALGVPTLRIADTRRSTITELSQRYGMVEDFSLEQSGQFKLRLEQKCADILSLRTACAPRHERLLADSVDVVDWFINLALEATSAS